MHTRVCTRTHARTDIRVIDEKQLVIGTGSGGAMSFQSWKDIYAAKIQQQENLSKALRERQKHCKIAALLCLNSQMHGQRKGKSIGDVHSPADEMDRPHSDESRMSRTSSSACSLSM